MTLATKEQDGVSLPYSAYPAYPDGTRFHFRPDGVLVGSADSVRAGAHDFFVNSLVAARRISLSSFMNRSASAIIEKVCGRKTVGETVALVAQEFAEPPEQVAPLVQGFFAREEKAKRIQLLTSPPESHYQITGSRKHYHPTKLTLELTYECNCRCLHCYIEAGAGASGATISERAERRLLSAKEITTLAGAFIDHGVDALEITGGEALLHPEFWPILEFCCSKAPVCALLSNGSLIDERTVQRFVDMGLLCVGISLDGPNAEIHDLFRGCPGSFRAATNAIRLLSRAGILTRAAMDVWPGNYHLMDETIDLARSLGANAFAASPLMYTGRAARGGYDLVLSDREEDRMWSVLYKNIERLGVRFMSADRPTDPTRDMVRYTGSCGIGTKDITVNGYGDVRSCPLTPSDLTIGNLTEMSYTEMFSRDLGFASLRNTGDDECKGCSSRYQCKPCIMKGIRAYSRMMAHGFDVCKWAHATQAAAFLEKNGWDYRSFLATDSVTDHISCAPSIAL